MSDESIQNSEEIKDTDIVFDCPYCGKSLAIDYHGAGLNIPCSDCGKLVAVPIPEGMELGDIDGTTEEQELTIINLRKALVAAEEKVKRLEADVSEMNSRRESLEKIRTDQIYRFGAIMEKNGIIQKALNEIADSARKISEIARQ